MVQQNGRKKKYKILWHRVIIALIILIALLAVVIWGIVSFFSFVIGLFSGDDNSSSATDAAASISSSVPSSSVVVTKPDSSSQTVPEVDLKVMIDPGHGGKDVGAMDVTETRYEKDDVLKLSLLVQQYLEEKGVEVVMTRDDDTFVSLDDRCIMANESGAELFVSIHRNLYEGEARGVEIWVSNKRFDIDTALGQNIMDGLERAGISRNRGVCFGYIGMPNKNYQVNRETNMPSCLIELGFMQDDIDNKLFDQNLDAYARAIADGIWKTATDFQLY